MNWSLALNALLFISVLGILFRTLKKKEAGIASSEERRPVLNAQAGLGDEIISVRKVEPTASPLSSSRPQDVFEKRENVVTQRDDVCTRDPVDSARCTKEEARAQRSLVIFLLAKPQRQLAGYEMLQTLLAAGLRFGEGQMFHYHQNRNGQGPVLCSVASATAEGTFDLPNIGAFNAKGLCLFMHLSGSETLDAERLDKMVEIAHQLSEGLDTYLLDDQRKPFTNETKLRYCQQLASTCC